MKRLPQESQRTRGSRPAGGLARRPRRTLGLTAPSLPPPFRASPESQPGARPCTSHPSSQLESEQQKRQDSLHVTAPGPHAQRRPCASRAQPRPRCAPRLLDKRKAFCPVHRERGPTGFHVKPRRLRATARWGLHSRGEPQPVDPPLLPASPASTLAPTRTTPFRGGL